MSYFAVGITDIDNCAPGPLFREEWCALQRKQDAQLAAAKAAGLTLPEWFKQQKITPAGKPLPDNGGGFGSNKMVILGGAAVVAFLLFRKK